MNYFKLKQLLQTDWQYECLWPGLIKSTSFFILLLFKRFSIKYVNLLTCIHVCMIYTQVALGSQIPNSENSNKRAIYFVLIRKKTIKDNCNATNYSLPTVNFCRTTHKQMWTQMGANCEKCNSFSYHTHTVYKMERKCLQPALGTALDVPGG